VIEAIGVVVPAHDEETLLPACLTALRQAAGAVSIPVHVVVVADTCTDRTGATARARGAEVISIRARNVGTARAAGMTGLLRLTAGHDPAVTWLATTDADTVVPSGWLRRQLDYADAGWDVVLGTVTVTDWDGHPPHVPGAFEQQYAFPSLRTGEDHALLAAATEAGCAVLQAGDLTVETSSRRQARAPDGFGQLLRTLAG